MSLTIFFLIYRILLFWNFLINELINLTSPRGSFAPKNYNNPVTPVQDIRKKQIFTNTDICFTSFIVLYPVSIICMYLAGNIWDFPLLVELLFLKTALYYIFQKEDQISKRQTNYPKGGPIMQKADTLSKRRTNCP